MCVRGRGCRSFRREVSRRQIAGQIESPPDCTVRWPHFSCLALRVTVEWGNRGARHERSQAWRPWGMRGSPGRATPKAGMSRRGTWPAPPWPWRIPTFRGPGPPGMSTAREMHMDPIWKQACFPPSFLICGSFQCQAVGAQWECFSAEFRGGLLADHPRAGPGSDWTLP